MRVNANTVLRSWTLLAAFGGSYAPDDMYMYMGVLCCFALFVCLTLLASFFLSSHLSFKTCTCIECRGFESHPRQLIFF